MEVTALIAVSIPCATFLIAFRWWLDSRQRQEPVDAAVLERLARLESWRTHSELGKLR